MERFKILKIQEHKKTEDTDYYFSILLKDNLKNTKFWLDCSITEKNNNYYISCDYVQEKQI